MIHQKTEQDVLYMRYSGHVNATIHAEIAKALAPGITTAELDGIAQRSLAKHDATSSFLGYNGFPGHICVSLNDEVGHGVPSDRIVRDGDVVKIDVGVQVGGLHTDSAFTHIVGVTDEPTHQLLNATESAMWEGISRARSGYHVSDISHALSESVTYSGHRVIRAAVGHGIGRDLHEEPQIVNFGPAGLGPKLRPFMAVAIEPIVTNGRPYLRKINRYTDVTVDGRTSAHFEHTVLITEEGPEVLTAWKHVSAREQLYPLSHGTFMREFTEGDDRQALVDLAARHMDPILLAAWGRRVHPNDLFNAIGCRTYVLKTKDNPLVGFFIYLRKKNVIHLNTLIVDSPMQGAGVGRAVMDFLESECRRLHIPAIELCVQTSNPRAMRFYDHLGYIVIGTAQVNTLTMQKRL